MTVPDQPPPAFQGTAFDVVVLAASAGGLRAITTIVEGLPADFPAALAVVQHLDPKHRSLLPQILKRRTQLHVAQADDGGRVQAGWVYTAPPDQHLLLNSDLTFTLARTELVHFVRPSADLLFESAAAAFHKRALAVVVTGTGSDGNMGVRSIKKMGGWVIVEDPATAEFNGMPDAAVRTGCADLIVPLADIGPAILRLVLEGSAS
jgi:two-component system, chemotaxis family, protein-glutamate methylesterase/glutaminase